MAYNYNINKRSKVMMYKKYHKKIAYRLIFFHALDVFHATNNQYIPQKSKSSISLKALANFTLLI